MKKLKKLLALTLCGLVAFTTVGCGPKTPTPTPGGGGEGDTPVVGEKVYTGNETEIRIAGHEAGVNLDWIRVLAREYEDMHLEDSYEEGKKGLKIIVVPTETQSSTVLANDFVMYVMTDRAESASKLGQDGNAMSIHDVVTGNATASDPSGDPYKWTFSGVKDGVLRDDLTIEDYIMEDYRSTLKANDGNYYGLPSYGLKEGLTYDANLFREKGLYLAHPDTFADENLVDYYECNFGKLYFTKSDGKNLVEGAKLHWGNDGIEGTEDDGLPTSLEEFFVMCEFMKNERNVDPLTAYKGPQRGQMLGNIWCSLIGYEYSARYLFKGEIEVVTGFDHSKPAMKGLNPADYPLPITERVTLDETNGWKYSMSPGYYYGMLFLRVAQSTDIKTKGNENKKDWWSWLSPASGEGAGHITTQRNFIMSPVEGNGRTTAMLVEGDYWYNELKKDGNGQHIKQYERTIASKLDRPLDVRWMALPTQVSGNTVDGDSVQKATERDAEGNLIPHEHVEKVTTSAAVIINKRYANRDAKFVNMLKDLMFHFYNGEALSLYTGQQGVYHAGMDYPVLEEDLANLSGFQRTTYEAYARSKKYAPAILQNYNHNMGQRAYNIEGSVAGYENGYADPSSGALDALLNAVGRANEGGWIVVNN